VVHINYVLNRFVESVNNEKSTDFHNLRKLWRIKKMTRAELVKIFLKIFI
jgi:hypothetical protein